MEFIESLVEIIGRWLGILFGTQNERMLRRYWHVVHEQINPWESKYRELPDAAFREMGARWRKHLSDGGGFEPILPEVFAACREASRRTLGMRHFDVQLIGGMVLHEGRISEMATGEGKTLVATSAAALNALAGKGIHIVTVNDYLARRDTQWMGPIYHFLGISVGCIQHEESFLYDSEYRDNLEDRMHNLRPCTRAEGYRADITYGTNNEFGFDYLRDNMKVRKEDQFQRGHPYAIVDEVDSILIDEARTPLIISGPAEENVEKYHTANRVAGRMERGEEIPGPERQKIHTNDFVVKEKEHMVILTERGIEKAQEMVGVGDFYTGDNMDWPHYIETALKAHHLYRRDRDYVVKDGDVIIVDEFTGRMMPGRRWSDGLHQAVESKEGLRIQEESQTYATITLQNYFKMYPKLAGMTGTAATEAVEFEKIYKLEVCIVPTNKPLNRVNFPDVVLGSEREKYDTIEEEIERLYFTGRPILVGTTSIEKSEILAERLKLRGIKHEVLNAKYHEKEAYIVARAGRLGQVTIATNMAGRGTDILLGPKPYGLEDLNDLFAWLENAFPRVLSVSVSSEDTFEGVSSRLLSDAKKFADKKLEDFKRQTEGSLTLDDLGPLSVEKRWDRLVEALSRAGKWDEKKPSSKQESLVDGVLRAVQLPDSLEHYFSGGVAKLGGLHILGTERHEARRIDNQLRGRAGRQGDPGSSQFFLCLEDDLFRKFAPPWIRPALQKLGLKEGERIESRLVSRSIGRAQKNVEAHNFDIRKNLVEYDQVRNEQRKVIYSLRQRVLGGENVRDTLLEMISNRIYDAIDRFLPKEMRAEWDTSGLAAWFDAKFSVKIPLELIEDKDRGTLDGILVEKMKQSYRERERDLARNMVRSRISEMVLRLCPDRVGEPDRQYDRLLEFMKREFDCTVELAEIKHRTVEEIVERLMKALEAQKSGSLDEFGAARMRELERFVLLDKIDEKWKDMLYNMDELRDVIGMRGYAQVDPKLEYKRDATELFRTMMEAIEDDVTDLLFRIRRVEASQERMARRWVATEFRKDEVQAFSGGGRGGEGEGAQGEEDKPRPIVAEKRIGRNESCPCGSGKKYKKCHGR